MGLTRMDAVPAGLENLVPAPRWVVRHPAGTVMLIAGADPAWPVGLAAPAACVPEPLPLWVRAIPATIPAATMARAPRMTSSLRRPRGSIAARSAASPRRNPGAGVP